MNFDNFDALESYVREEGLEAWNFDDQEIKDYCENVLGWHCFKQEYDIIEYVEGGLDMYVFDHEGDIFEYTRDNDPDYVKYNPPNRNSISGYRYVDVMKKLQTLADEHGYERIYDYLNEFK